MSKRETIAKYIIDEVREIRYVKSITREPKSEDELSKASLPHCLVETADESRGDMDMDGTRSATIDFLINVVVGGKDRDSQRNLIFEAIERKLTADRTLNGNCYDCSVVDILTREIDTAKPYASGALVFRVVYHYESGTP